MTRKPRKHADDLRAASRLAIEATRGVTSLVESMHRTIASGPDALGRPLEAPARLLTGLVYGSIRGVTGLVGSSIDAVLAQVGPLLGESAPGLEREILLAVLNGVLGDYLSETGSALAIPMQLRSGGHPFEVKRSALEETFPAPRSKLLVLVHGSCACDLQWKRQGHDHGAALARDLGYTPVHVQYNSGLHISTNGHSMALLLEQLVAEWPAPLDDLVILTHSMGGLVARAACHSAEAAGHRWRPQLRKLVGLGTPHHGAPLERGGNWIDVVLGSTRYSAPLAQLGRIRSAGITDLRFGSVADEDWHGRDRFKHGADPRLRVKLPEGVQCYAVAGTTALKAGGRLPSDGMVPVDSALGRHPRPELTLAFPEAHQLIAFGTSHLDLLCRPEVYERIRTWLAA